MKIVMFRESLAQSVASDLVTFGFLLLCIYVSHGSKLWTLVTGCMFIVFAVSKIGTVFSKERPTFYSYDEMRKWIDKQEKENEQIL